MPKCLLGIIRQKGFQLGLGPLGFEVGLPAKDSGQVGPYYEHGIGGRQRKLALIHAARIMDQADQLAADLKGEYSQSRHARRSVQLPRLFHAPRSSPSTPRWRAIRG